MCSTFLWWFHIYSHSHASVSSPQGRVNMFKYLTPPSPPLLRCFIALISSSFYIAATSIHHYLFIITLPPSFTAFINTAFILIQLVSCVIAFGPTGLSLALSNIFFISSNMRFRVILNDLNDKTLKILRTLNTLNMLIADRLRIVWHKCNKYGVTSGFWTCPRLNALAASGCCTTLAHM